MGAPYGELHAHSAYTFLEGTDLPETLIVQAHELGLGALGILDVDGMYSAVQTAQAAKTVGVPTVFGAELTVAATPDESGWAPAPLGVASSAQVRLPVLAVNQQGYHELCAAISAHNLNHPGQRKVPWELGELARFQRGNWRVLTGTAHGPLRQALRSGGTSAARAVLSRLQDLFGPDRVVVESCLHPGDPYDLGATLAELGREHRVEVVATGAVRCSSPRQQFLADVMTASRLNLELKAARPHLPPFGSFLRGEAEMKRIHRAYPRAVETAGELAQEWAFDLTLMEPELPLCDIPPGHTNDTWLRELTYRGARQRYGSAEQDPAAWQTIEHELKIITELGFSGYFLIVKDIVDFCRQQDILAQGRGSAANSAVCFSLGITAVDAVRHHLLFERFLSPERTGPPDIDIDIESARREEVIQYVYSRYGRERAAQVANTISYRPRSAIRAAGKALGYSEEVLKGWSKELSRGWSGTGGQSSIPPLVRGIGASLQKLPRHLGIHPGGIVLTRTPVSEICPIGWAAKENRTVLQWDKDDCADAGLVKFDLLGLGMLTALRKSFNWLKALGVVGTDREALGLYNLPPEDQRVYDLLCAGESVGVFQVESRAQMNTLPRLQPREFYDLVIEVALIRPGPIQGKAVNPFLRRRGGYEEATCHPLLAGILERTLGVPLFQEQLMQIAIVGAGFTAAEADGLRRALSSKRHVEKMEEIRPRLLAGMEAHGLPSDLQEELYDSLRGFAEFGFPESHAFSFAYLVYASAWLKVFFPEHFYASILASQPMGFYSPASLIADARRHGVTCLGPSVTYSVEEASVQTADGQELTPDQIEVEFPADRLMRTHPNWVIRLGLDSINGLSGQIISRIVQARQAGPFHSLEDFARRTNARVSELELLAQAGAFSDLGVSRRRALWAAAQLANPHEEQPFLPGTQLGQAAPMLPGMTEGEELETDYQVLKLSAGKHPMQLVRSELEGERVLPLAELADAEGERVVKIGGLITHRQRPGTAHGVTFLSLEDETGLANVVCTGGFWKCYGQIIMTSRALVVTGRLEKKDGAISVRAQKVERLSVRVDVLSRDFR